MGILEALKALFAGDDAKIKIIDGLKLDSDDASKIAELTQKIAELEKAAGGKTDPKTPPADPNDIKGVISGMEAQIKSLEALLKTEADNRANSDKLAKEMQAKEHAKKVDEAIKKAIEEERIAPKADADIAAWKGYFEKDFDAAAFALSKIPGKTVQAKSDSQEAAPVQTAVVDRASLIENAKNAFAENSK